jgi:hypothetical protein
MSIIVANTKARPTNTDYVDNNKTIAADLFPSVERLLEVRCFVIHIDHCWNDRIVRQRKQSFWLKRDINDNSCLMTKGNLYTSIDIIELST